jgi:hypothetical protein
MREPGPETKERIRINCERYRNSPPICVSLTDSQRRAAQALEEQQREREAAEERERRYRRVRRMAITWSVLALVGIGLIVAFAFLHQLIFAAFMLQPLVGSVFDALKSIHEWRHFDD